MSLALFYHMLYINPAFCWSSPSKQFYEKGFHCIGSKQHKFGASIFFKSTLGLFSGYMGGGGEEQTNALLPVQDSSVSLPDWVWFRLTGILFC